MNGVAFRAVGLGMLLGSFTIDVSYHIVWPKVSALKICGEFDVSCMDHRLPCLPLNNDVLALFQ